MVPVIAGAGGWGVGVFMSQPFFLAVCILGREVHLFYHCLAYLHFQQFWKKDPGFWQLPVGCFYVFRHG